MSIEAPVAEAWEALLDALTGLAHLSKDDWNERRGADPIARTINAARDIVTEHRPLIEAALAAPLDVAPHPGEQHDFRTTCLRCGDRGTLFVAILGPDEAATIAPIADRLAADPA